MPDIQASNRLSYEAFQELICSETANRLGNGYHTELIHIYKTNSQLLDGLVIRNDKHFAGPTLYLNDHYESYRLGKEAETIIKELILDYHMFARNNHLPESGFSFELDAVHDRIIYCLIGAESNQDLLNQSPHIRFLDFAIIFQYLAVQDSNGLGTVRITNEHAKLWGVGADELYEIARTNTAGLLPVKLMAMREVLSLLPVQEEVSFLPPSENPSMYVLTNTSGLQGATCILYPGVLEQFAAKTGSGFYLLPSSIHEFLLLPVSQNSSSSSPLTGQDEDEKDALSEIVREINSTQIKPEDVLTNRAYYYNAVTKTIE